MLSVFPLGASVEETGDVRLRFGAAQIDGMGLEDMTVMASSVFWVRRFRGWIKCYVEAV